MKRPAPMRLVSAMALLLAGGCSVAPTRLPAPLPVAKAAQETQAGTAKSLTTAEAPRTELRELPTPLSQEEMDTPSAGVSIRDTLPAGLHGPALSVNLAALPLPTFVNEVLGNSLGLTFQLDPEVEKLNQLVTLRTSRPQSPAEFYRIARQVLGDYGVEMIADGPIVKVKMAAAGTTLEPPIIYSGRAMPEVPVTHRPVFYLMQLDTIRSSEASRWLKAIYGSDVKVEESSERNAVLLSGRPDQVRQAADAVRVFDRPAMRGRVSTRLEPAFMSAEQLAAKLTEVLVAQGYGASTTLGVPASILVMPVPAVNSVILFAADPAVLRHAATWARDLDRPNPASGNRSIFYYQVQNTKAADIASVLGGSLGARASSSATTIAATGNPNAGSAPPPQSTAGGSGIGIGIVVDEPRNSLIFQGDPAEWERLLPLIKQMDKETRQVMIELTIAEVTLDDSEEFGINWFAKTNPGRFNGSLSFGTLPEVGKVAGTGLNYLLDVAGQSRAMLRAYANDQRVTILSTPRLMVKSGEEAKIDVGTEVPIITSRNTSPQTTEGTSSLLQSIQYRKTGIILSMTPTVYSDDRVDLTLSQEVSEALPMAEGDSLGSPSIYNRSVGTSLSLRDGSSIVIGGLMSHRQSGGGNGVPFLKDIPVVGNLFKSQSKTKNKTELVLMIVPYIVGSNERATELTRAIGDQLELLELPSSTLMLPLPSAEQHPPAFPPATVH
ncbi:secretin N-terminal domain-containing protein [Stenotrophomonas sp. PS02297]|uniref:secretin N-terminal domain-containing protein n=1 Tax=Stenotrophomonas sp. PS02297 TaxID=2991423 RepID=UPI00249C4F41|nr:secretin N-terminal domain-containing protein [Stenotrophomonas sp. PS02297]